ncbi:MAG: enoyl-CoA hydratase [Deltaproteobacteria bacterium RBG_16_71_12]|nr:MAG: enoyl-CoA hydratase [Deltaproteobacteria bacterium RBG_16_71_12]
MADLVEKRGSAGVVTLVLRRPEALNALNAGLIDALRAEVEAVCVRRDVRALILAGDERAFSAGADLKERAGMSAEQTRAFLRKIRGIMDLVERVPIPTLAAIEGVAFGGGLELALSCDIRVLGKSATVGLTEVSLGIIPGAGGTQRLPRLIGAARAKELIFTARRLSADDAFAWGLCTHVVEAGGALATCEAIAAEIAKNAPIAVEAAKAAIDGGIGAGISEGLLLEQRAYEVTLHTEDRREALAAFAEKRPPIFHGR